MCLKEGCDGSSYLPRRPFELAFFWPAGKLLAISYQLSEKQTCRIKDPAIFWLTVES